MKYFGAIDQGTTSSRFIVFDETGSIVKQHQQEFTQYLPDEVSVEHDPNEIWESVLNCINEVDKEFSIDQLDSIGITNQRETTLAWRKSTAEPLHNALVWQDTRTQNICDELKGLTELEESFNKTGLPIATYFSLSKILWLLLTGEHVTDVTNASRTLLMDLETLNWMKDILMTLDIPESSLPKIKPSLYNFGTNSDLLKSVPLTSVLGDQQAALFGQNCINSGDVKNTYGTRLLCVNKYRK